MQIRKRMNKQTGNSQFKHYMLLDIETLRHKNMCLITERKHLYSYLTSL